MTELNDCREQVKAAIAEGLPIVYADETVFTKHTMKNTDYIRAHNAMTIDGKRTYQPYLTAVAGVSSDRGVDFMQTFSHSLNSELFASFVERISVSRDGKPFALFMDRAAFHHSAYTLEQLKRLHVRPILNVTASPQYNPIEGCFSTVKNFYKRRRLNYIVNDEDINYQKLIRESFKQLTIEIVRKQIDYCTAQLLAETQENREVQKCR